MTLIEDPYTEKDARLHLLRIRELIGAAGDRTDLAHGLHAGLSLHDGIAKLTATLTASGSTNASDTHPLSTFDFHAPAQFDVFTPPSQSPPPKTVKSIALSPWHPPPYHLRSKGHLLYLNITTNEGEQHQITSHVTGFFVNKSTNNKFDPFPRTSPKSFHAHSLLSLISKISPSFDSAFKSLQDLNANRDPLSSFQLSNATPATPWLVPESSSSLSAHVSDQCRSQESLLISGAENTETLRDWNEEFQTTRELPRDTVQDRVFRERVNSKLFSDYTQAAMHGAILIAKGEVGSLNPTEPRDAQIFVYNNIFFSFGTDGVGTFQNEGGDEAARVATGKDVNGVRTVNQLDLNDLSTPGTVIVDYLGRRIVAQSIVPGIFKQRDPGESQIDYGGVDGKDVVAENEAFTSPFEKLSAALHVKKHPVWDKDGIRHDLEASVETKGLIGTDGRKYALDLYRITPLDLNWVQAHWNGNGQADTNSDQEGKRCYPHRMSILRPELIDVYWKLKLREFVKFELEKTSPTSDPENTHVNDTVESNKEGEQLENQNQSNEPNGRKHDPDQTSRGATTSENAKENGMSEEATEDTGNESSINELQVSQAQPLENDGGDPDRIDISGFHFALNPDVFTDQRPQTDDEKEQWSKDEADVRAVSSFLTDEIIPHFISDLREGEIGFPMDGQSLASHMHKRGINMRYLGKVTQLLQDPKDSRLQALKRLTTQEMISRAFKHVSNRYLRNLPTPFSIPCISHLLNCFLGSSLCSHPQVEIDRDIRLLYPDQVLEFENIQPDKLHQQISEEVFLRFRYDLEQDWLSRIKHVQMFRECAKKLGLQLVAKEYSFSDNVVVDLGDETNQVQSGSPVTQLANGKPASGGKKKKKQGGNGSPNRIVTQSPFPTQTFHPDDIVNVVPVIKESAPRSLLADEALEAGRASISQNQRELGQELFFETLHLHEQIYGIIHPEVARVYYQLSTQFYSLSDRSIATELARKAVIVSERTLGLDSHETLLGYLNLALLEHSNNNTRFALTYVRHALSLWKIIYGPDHPDSITTLNNVAVMLQNMRYYHDSRTWYEAAYSVCQRVSGASSVASATLVFQLAQALALDQDSKGAVVRMREAYNLFKETLGPDDRNTKEAENWLDQLTQNAVSIAKHAKDVQARRLRRLNNFSIRDSALRPQPGLTVAPSSSTNAQADDLVAKASAASGANAAAGSGMTFDERSVEELLKYIEGNAANGGDASSMGKKARKRPSHPIKRQQKPSEA